MTLNFSTRDCLNVKRKMFIKTWILFQVSKQCFDSHYKHFPFSTWSELVELSLLANKLYWISRHFRVWWTARNLLVVNKIIRKLLNICMNFHEIFSPKEISALTIFSACKSLSLNFSSEIFTAWRLRKFSSPIASSETNARLFVFVFLYSKVLSTSVCFVNKLDLSPFNSCWLRNEESNSECVYDFQNL